jgi:transglutaminase-like putative cysteine protease
VSTALAPPPRKYFVDAPPRTATRDRKVRTASNDPVLPVWVARLIAFAALAAWGALHWMSMLEPSEPGRGWTVLLVGLLGAGAMLAAGRLERRRRMLAAALALIPLLALMLLAGRVANELVLPTGWSELAGGISRGLSDLPGVRVPYRGLDQWVRTVIPLGGAALVMLAAVLAFWPRRERLGFPFAALLVLITLYVVPVVALDFTGEFLRGAVFTLLMVAFLRLEKLRRTDSLAAVALVLAATVVALVAAPALNRDQPWFDYETWAAETSSSKSTTFTWEHSYTGLNWPRDGRELLRVRARQAAYWKAENLDVFDGERWLRSQVNYAAPETPEGNPRLVRRWTQELKISIRNLRSDQFITAGYAFDVDIPRMTTVPTLDGLVVPGRTLRRGDAYTTQVYTPQPSENQRRRSSIDYQESLKPYTTIYAATAGMTGSPRSYLTFPFFGAEGGRIDSPDPTFETPETLLQRAHLSRTYALSQRLLEDSRTPEDYVQNVLEYLGNTAEYTYSETPPPSARTLDGFLFDAKQGYCQQFSGAMALLLRMAGIPARVATGFSTGATDVKTGEYVVRDFDAHSWVEVYYPDFGWVTFDPTPAASPARSQPADALSTGGASTGGTPISPGDPLAGRGAGVPVAAESRSWWEYPLFALALLAAAALGFLAVRRWRRGAPPALTELERALKRTRAELAPGTTLHALETRFAATPGAAAYVRALRESRYRDAPARPTRAQRRGLRSELGRGGGLLGRLRAWWALPPR